MGSYIIRRLLWIPITVIAVSILVFLMVRFIPGNIVDLIIAQSSQGNVDVVADRLAVMHAFGLDVPVYVQYVHWAISFYMAVWVFLCGTTQISLLILCKVYQ